MLSWFLKTIMLFDRVWHIFILWVVRDVCSGWFMLEQRGDSENQATRKSNKQKWVQWIWFFGPANCPVLGDLVLKSFLILTPIIYCWWDVSHCWWEVQTMMGRGLASDPGMLRIGKWSCQWLPHKICLIKELRFYFNLRWHYISI